MKEFQDLFNALAAFSLAQWLIVALAWAISHLAGYFVFTRWLIRRNWKLHEHLKRPVILVKPVLPSGDPCPGGDLTTELNLLQANGFLNVSEIVADYRSFNPRDSHSVVVLGYREGMAGIDDLLTRLKSHHTPLIIYTYGNNRINDADKAKFDTYPYAVPANFPLSLLNQIFATVASFPYDPK